MRRVAAVLLSALVLTSVQAEPVRIDSGLVEGVTLAFGCACLARHSASGSAAARAALARPAAGAALGRRVPRRPPSADVLAGAAHADDEPLLRQRGDERRLPVPERLGARRAAPRSCR